MGGRFSAVRLVGDTPDGGIAVMPNNTNQWPTYYRNRAEISMKKKFPEGYVIVHEEEVESNPAARDGRYENEDFEYNGAYERIRRSTITQYRITFRAASSEGKPSPPPVNLVPLPSKKETPPLEEVAAATTGADQVSGSLIAPS